MATVINGSDNFNTNNVATQTEFDARELPLGVGQTWQNVGASRASAVTYTNNTGRPIIVAVTGANASYSYIPFYIDGQLVIYPKGRDTSSATTQASLAMVVPNGSTYMASIDNSDNESFMYWWELR
jgi:hypothetical protein